MAKLPTGFYRRKDGLLEYKFFVDGRRKSVYGATVKECRGKADELRDRIRRGLLEDQETLTLRKYFSEWEDRRVKLVKPSTLYADKRRFKRIDDALGRKKLKNIERRDVFKLQADLSRGLSSKGVNDIISLLRSIMESAVNDRIIPYNPTAGVRALPKTEDEKNALEEKHRFLTSEEIETFFGYADGSIYHNLFMFLLLTGTRCGEAGALTWGDIDVTNGVIHITKTVTRVDDRKFIIGPPKTMDSKRDIVLTDQVKTLLDAQRKQQEGLFGLRATRPSANVFTTLQGLLINQSNTSPTIANICRKATRDGHEIERFTSHAFRHTFISHELAIGIPLNVIAAQVGHSNTLTLQKYYSHEDPDKIKEAFRMVSENVERIVKIS